MDTAELIYEWVKDNYGESEADEPSWDYESLAGYLDEKQADKLNNAPQILKEYEDAERAEYIQRCEKCGSLKITAHIDEDYFSNPLRYSCQCGNTWAG